MKNSSELLWKPKEKRRKNSKLSFFIDFVNDKFRLHLSLAYSPLWDWSIRCPEDFWTAVWDFNGIIGDKGSPALISKDTMPSAKFFPHGKINFAENLLRNPNDAPAIIAWDERGYQTNVLSRRQLLNETAALAAWLQAQGIKPGDRVCAYMPNIPETIVALLATSALGAVFSSCSVDFGVDGVIERFGQITPSVLITVDGYRYGGKAFDRRQEVAAIVEKIPSLRAVMMISYLTEMPIPTHYHPRWETPPPDSAPTLGFYHTDFNAPLAVLYSSGTTGVPKCIVHGAGGTLLQHAKEHALQTDIRAGDKVFYFTTCGWMMWNWLVSALMQEAAVVLYEGNPMTPTPTHLWDMAAAEKITLFGTSAKYIDALRKSSISLKQTHDLSALKTVYSTGSPLLADSFRYVYEAIKDDVHLASISGGTDIVSCFLLGNPLDAVHTGEIQCRGLGMEMAVFDDNGKPQIGEVGELVCKAPFPSMPVGFWNDNSGEKYRNAYFQRFPGVWTHGDFATHNANDSFVIHGRSDTTLNPGGVRIGTAEIYRHVEKFDEILESVVIGQQQNDDERIILFVRLANGADLNDDLKRRICDTIRQNASPRHVPARIITIADIPRTRSGKISEVAVRQTVHHQAIKNANALANPESLALFRNLAELAN